MQQPSLYLKWVKTQKKTYKTQSEKTPYSFLMQGIDLANTCDFEYKTSLNQRLHVELCLMKLASITNAGEIEKKKIKQNIISPKEVEALKASTTKKPVDTEASSTENDVTHTPNVSTETQNSSEENQSISTEKEKQSYSTEANPKEEIQQQQVEEPQENKTNQPASGLSLSAIKKKKQLLQEQQNNKKEAIVLDESFTEEDFQKAWKDYIKKLEERGNKILTSTLESGEPKLNGTEIQLTYPNNTMKDSVLKAQNKLLSFLSERLQNTNLRLHIHVNMEEAKKYAYTPREKYMKMLESNSALEKLRKTFDLDI